MKYKERKQHIVKQQNTIVPGIVLGLFICNRGESVAHGHLVVSGHIFGCHNLRRDAMALSRKAWDAVKHHTIHRTAPYNKHNANSSDYWKPCPRMYFVVRCEMKELLLFFSD